MSKKLLIILSIILLIVSIGLSYLYFSQGGGIIPYSVKYKPAINAGGQEVLNGGPKTEECPMNGQKYSKDQEDRWQKRRPMGVMIENHTQARPQSGLTNADIIYEAVAEGGITRFLAMFYCEDSKIVGPVRSARIYYVKLLQEYGHLPLYAHVGGANTPGPADSLGEIRELGWDAYNDLNQFAVPFPYYYRDYDRLPNRATEHTMYASTEKLWAYAKKERDLTEKDKKGKMWDETFEKWKFKDDAKEKDRGKAGNISLGFWEQFGKDYGVIWQYDPALNAYKRANGGSSHLDKNDGTQITVKNVVVVFADESDANDGYEGGHLLYDVVGSGTGLLFQDGIAVKTTWRKQDEETRMKFFDSGGKEVELVRGKIFVEILPTGNKVIY